MVETRGLTDLEIVVQEIVEGKIELELPDEDEGTGDANV